MIKLTTASLMNYIFQLTHTLKKVWLTTAVAVGSLLLVVLLTGLGLAIFKTPTHQPSNTTAKITKTGSADQTIAVLTINGVIVDITSDQSLFTAETGVVSAEEMARLLDDIVADEAVKAIVLKINSPGGTVVASDQLYRKIAAVAEVKPVIASFSDLAASGGYYIAMGASTVMAHPSSITGSIGVVFQTLNVSELLDTVGVKLIAIKSGELKDIGSPGHPLTEQERLVLQSVVNDAFSEFVSVVQLGTGLTESEVLKLADGRIYSGKQAFELGLVDTLGSFEDALKLAATEANLSDPQIVTYGNKSVLESLLGVVSQKTSLFGQVEQTLPHAGLMYVVEF